MCQRYIFPLFGGFSLLSFMEQRRTNELLLKQVETRIWTMCGLKIVARLSKGSATIGSSHQNVAESLHENINYPLERRKSPFRRHSTRLRGWYCQYFLTLLKLFPCKGLIQFAHFMMMKTINLAWNLNMGNTIFIFWIQRELKVRKHFLHLCFYLCLYPFLYFSFFCVYVW